MKAAGFNTTSIYFSWGYHSPREGEYDFTGIRDMDFHPFNYGVDPIPFDGLWHRLRANGDTTSLEDYSICALAARQNRFDRPSGGTNTLRPYRLCLPFRRGALCRRCCATMPKRRA
jgi:hypothetical protein